MLGKRSGLNRSDSPRAIQASDGGSFVAEVDDPQILDGSYDPTFTIGLAAKDIGLGLSIARESGGPMTVTIVVGKTIEAARDRYGVDADTLFPAELLEEQVGKSLCAP